MTPAEFKRKWARYSGKETATYQEHFNDLCALLGQPSPAAADPTGSESFCFQKRVVKDAELLALDDSGRVAEEPDADRERGFADVWKRGFFAWEYKGKKKNLDAAYQQLLIPLCAVPVSLVGTFVLFPLFGFSINTLSLFGGFSYVSREQVIAFLEEAKESVLARVV
jgi:hypothetical protein